MPPYGWERQLHLAKVLRMPMRRRLRKVGLAIYRQESKGCKPLDKTRFVMYNDVRSGYLTIVGAKRVRVSAWRLVG
jgi:hypothetical protein